MLIDDVIVMWPMRIPQTKYQQKLKNDVIIEFRLPEWKFQIDTNSRSQDLACSLFFPVKLGLSILPDVKNGPF